MICVVQRVTESAVRVGGEVVGQIGVGLLVLASVHRRDGDADVAWIAAKLAGLRVFPSLDGTKAYDRDVREVGGGILLVSNFTVAAATAKGRRPTLEAAADPVAARPLFEALVEAVRAAGVSPVETGRFGAEMAVSLINAGPLTLIVESPAKTVG
jgi:D-tyrosyl-tRNA(Tyr) deacylase